MTVDKTYEAWKARLDKKNEATSNTEPQKQNDNKTYEAWKARLDKKNENSKPSLVSQINNPFKVDIGGYVDGINRHEYNTQLTNSQNTVNTAPNELAYLDSLLGQYNNTSPYGQKQRKAINTQINELTGELDKAQQFADNDRYANLQNSADYDKSALKGQQIQDKSTTFKPTSGGMSVSGIGANFDNKSNVFMTEQEKKNYNYLLATEGEQAARDYQNSIIEPLNYRQGEYIAQDLREIDNPYTKPIAYTAQGFGAGVDQFASGAGQLFSKDALATSPQAFASGIISSELTGIGKVGYDLSKVAGNMAPSIALGGLSGVGIIGSTSMGLSAGGNSYTEGLNSGMTHEEALKYGALIGAAETALQSTVGGIAKLGGISTKATAKIAGIESATKRALATYATHTGAEALEEGTQEVLEPIIRALVTGDEYERANIEDIAYAALLGGLMGGVSSVPSAVKAYNTPTPSQMEAAAQQTSATPQKPVSALTDIVSTARNNNGTISNNTAKAILTNPEMMSELSQLVKIDLTNANSASQQRNVIKTAVASLAQSNANMINITPAVADTATATPTQATNTMQPTIANNATVDNISQPINNGIAQTDNAIQPINNANTAQPIDENRQKFINEIISNPELRNLIGVNIEGLTGEALTNAVSKAADAYFGKTTQQQGYYLNGEKLSAEDVETLPSFLGAYGIDASNMSTNEQVQSAQKLINQQKLGSAPILSSLGSKGNSTANAQYDGANQNPNQYIKSFLDYYTAGQTGTQYNNVQTANDILTDAQKKAAHEAGQTDTQATLDSDIEKSSETIMYGKDSGIVANKHSEKLGRATYNFYDKLAKLFGMKVLITPDLEHGARGSYDSNTGTISIHPDYAASGMLVIAHELTHRFQNLAPVEYRKYRDIAVRAVTAETSDVFGESGEVLRKIDSYGKSKVALNTEEAMDEIAADYTRKMIEDGTLFSDVVKADKHVAFKWLENLRNFIKSIKKAFTGNKSAQDNLAMDEYGVTMATLENAERAWTAAYNASAKATEGKTQLPKAESESKTEKNTTDSGVSYSIGHIVGKNGDYGTGVILDTKIFKGKSPRKWGEILNKFVYDKLAGTEVEVYDKNGVPETIQFAKLNERVRKNGAKNNHKVIDKLVHIKGNNIKSLAVVHLSEILKSSDPNKERRNFEHTHQWLDENGWRFRTVYLKDETETIYEAVLNIGVNDTRNILYDINNIREIDDGVFAKLPFDGRKSTNGRGSLINNDFSNEETISQDTADVKSKSEDGVRFSLSSPVEETKDLIAIHNLGADNLLSSLDLGGFPMPSIAVVRADVPYEQYGDISVVFGKSTIDPSNPRNKVYSGDAWTPTVPGLRYEADKAVAKKLHNKYYELYRKYGKDNTQALYPFGNYPSDHLNNRGGEQALLEELADDTSMMQTFLLDTGKPTIKTIEKETVSKLSDDEIAHYDYVIDKMGSDIIAKLEVPKNTSPLEHRRAWKEEYIKEFENVYRSFYSDVYGFTSEETDNAMKSDYKPMPRRASMVYKYLKNGAETKRTEPDYKATEAAIRDATNSTEYETWLHDTFDGIEGKRGIRNNKDPYTAQGSSRSFDALHYEVSLENMVHAMREQDEKGGNAFAGGADIWGVATNEYSSIEDIKSDAGRLNAISREEYDDMRSEYTERLLNIAAELSNKDADNYLIATDNAAAAVVEVLRKKKTAATIERALKTYPQLNVEKGVGNKILTLFNDIKEMPTEYFEAKPQRAVGFDEILAAVIPNDTNANLKESLQQKGIPIVEYTKDDKTDRLEKINSVENVRFSLPDDSSDSKPKRKQTKKATSSTTENKIVEKYARQLVKKYGSNTNSTELYSELQEATRLLKGNDKDYNKAVSIINDIAETIADTAVEYDNEAYQEYSGLRNYLKDTQFTISDADSKNFPEYNNTRRKYFNKLRLKKDTTTNIDSLYEELAEIYPEFFDSSKQTHPADQLQQIFNTIDAIYKRKEINPFKDDIADATAYISEDIIASLTELTQTKPVDADKTSKSEGTTESEADTDDSSKSNMSEASEKLKALAQLYGQYDMGELALREVVVPKKIGETQDDYTSQYVRTVMESAVASETGTSVFEEEILNGTFSYTRITDESARAKADMELLRYGFDECINKWNAIVESGKMVNKYDIALAETLLLEASKRKDTAVAIDLTTSIAALGTQAGQTVQALAMLKKMSGSAQLVSANKSIKKLQEDLDKRYGNKAPKLKIPEELTDKLATSTDPNEIEKIMEKIKDEVATQIPTTAFDKWNAWRYLAMLGNPRTHIRNLLGNTIFSGTVIIKDAVGVALEGAVGMVNKDFVKTKSLKSLSPAKRKQYAQFIAKDFEEVKEIITSGSKYNTMGDILSRRAVFKNKYLEWARNANFTLLEKEDVIFLKAHYGRALSGYFFANNIDPTKLDMENESDIAKLAKAKSYAIQEAQKATFRQASELATALNNFGKSHLLAEFAVEGIVPFKKTPINIAKSGIEYSAVGLLNNIIFNSNKVRTGKMTVSDYLDKMASGLTGTGIMAVGAYMVMQGILRAGNDDDKLSAFEKMQGIQSYSLHFGDKTYTIDWLAPSSLPLFMGAELWKSIQGEYDDMEIGELFSKFLDTATMIVDPIVELSMLSSLNSALESAQFGNNAISAIASEVATSYLGQAVPTLLGQIARTIDPVTRTTYTDKNSNIPSNIQYFTDAVRKKIPVLSQSSTPYMNNWGEIQTTNSTVFRAIENFVSPGYYETVTTSKTESQLMKLYEDTGETSVFPSKPSKYITVDKMRIDFTEKEYLEYAKVKGETSLDTVTAVLGASLYNGLDDGQKVYAVKKAYDYAGDVAKMKMSDFELSEIYQSIYDGEVDAGLYITSCAATKDIVTIKDKEGDVITSKQEQVQRELYDAYKSKEISKGELELIYAMDYAGDFPWGKMR